MVIGRIFMAPLLAALLVVGLLGGAGAQEALSEADTRAARAVIAAQLEAFARDDGAAAYAFAAPEIKQIFPSAERFMAMVRAQYAPLYRARHVELREAIALPDMLIQRLHVVGEDGVAVLATYTLRRQADASWRITGCFLAPAADQPI